jgi:hypothetical protein
MKSAPKAISALAALAAVGAVAAPAATAAGSANSCGNPAGSKIFSQFNDPHNYFLAPDGGFEAGAEGWTLDGSSVIDGNESFSLNGAGDARSLSLPAGSSATSPSVCVTRHHPLFRFVAKRSAVVVRPHGGAHAAGEPRLRVEVIYLNGKGHRKTRVAAKLRAGEEWRPTRKIAIATGRATGRRKRKIGNVKFRVTPIGAADWQIDDLYVDPHARR